MTGNARVVGARSTRVDAVEKVSGRARYVDDLEPAGTLHCKVAVSAYPHAEILSIDVAAAREMPGVVAVLTAKDVPGENQIGVSVADQPLLATTRVRMLSDRIALVAADTLEQAAAAARAIRVDYRELPVVRGTDEAVAPGTIALHEGGNVQTRKRVIKGDTAQAFEKAQLILENEFESGYQEHAYLETNGVLAIPEPDGGVTVHASAQAPFYVQKAVARVLGLDLSRVRVIQATTGGGFGGKEDYPSEPAACAALLARATGRPVKLVYTRGEDIAWSSKRHAMKIRNKLGVDAEGKLVAAQVHIACDAGAYTGLSAIVSERANSTAIGPYRSPAVRVDTDVIYTNNLFGGAFRGFGTPQVTFAMETQLDELAEKLGISPAEIRRRNMLGVGDQTATCQPLRESAPGLKVLEAALERSGYEAKRQEMLAFNRSSPTLKKGIGIGCCFYGCCLHAGGQYLEGSGALLHVRPDGSVQVAIGGTEIGQGAFTVAAQLVAQELGLPVSRVRVMPTSTESVPDSGPTVASRTTVMSGNAALDAARRVRARMLEVAAKKLALPVAELAVVAGGFGRPGGPALIGFQDAIKACIERKVNLTSEGWYAPPRKEFDPQTGLGEAYSTYCFGTQIAEVEVDLRSGRTRVVRFTAAHDVGQAINPAMLEGQVEGGVVQGMGWALMEELKLKDGRCLNANFTDYLIPTFLDAPPVDVLFIEDPYSAGPYGAKGIGEPSLIPAAAAIANAVSLATGHRFRKLPLTPERVLLELEAAGKLP